MNYQWISQPSPTPSAPTPYGSYVTTDLFGGTFDSIRHSSYNADPSASDPAGSTSSTTSTTSIRFPFDPNNFATSHPQHPPCSDSLHSSPITTVLPIRPKFHLDFPNPDCCPTILLATPPTSSCANCNSHHSSAPPPQLHQQPLPGILQSPHRVRHQNSHHSQLQHQHHFYKKPRVQSLLVRNNVPPPNPNRPQVHRPSVVFGLHHQLQYQLQTRARSRSPRRSNIRLTPNPQRSDANYSGPAPDSTTTSRPKGIHVATSTRIEAAQPHQRPFNPYTKAEHDHASHTHGADTLTVFYTTSTTNVISSQTAIHLCSTMSPRSSPTPVSLPKTFRISSSGPIPSGTMTSTATPPRSTSLSLHPSPPEQKSTRSYSSPSQPDCHPTCHTVHVFACHATEEGNLLNLLQYTALPQCTRFLCPRLRNHWEDDLRRLARSPSQMAKKSSRHHSSLHGVGNRQEIYSGR